MQSSRLSKWLLIGLLLGALPAVRADGNLEAKRSDKISYSFFIIPNIAGTSDTFPYGINDRGQLVGAFQDNLFFSHGFFLSRGAFKTFEFPGAVLQTTGTGINNQGKIVGSYADSQLFLHGFILADGVFTTIDLPGEVNTEFWGINDLGQIIGAVHSTQGFLLDRGTFTPLNAPGTVGSTAPFGINNRGEIVGIVVRPFETPQQQGFLLDARGYTIVSIPGAGNVQARGINDNGQIAGFFDDSPGHTHGFVLEHGEFTQVDAPGADHTALVGINNRGQIIGRYVKSSEFFGFVATPVRNGFGPH